MEWSWADLRSARKACDASWQAHNGKRGPDLTRRCLTLDARPQERGLKFRLKGESFGLERPRFRLKAGLQPRDCSLAIRLVYVAYLGRDPPRPTPTPKPEGHPC